MVVVVGGARQLLTPLPALPTRRLLTAQAARLLTQPQRLLPPVSRKFLACVLVSESRPQSGS